METTKIVSSMQLVNKRNTSPDSPHQQLMMTSAVTAEKIEDGLAAPRRPPPKHSTSLARVA